MLAAYLALAYVQHLGGPPLASAAIVVPVMAGFGYALQRPLLNRTLGLSIVV